MSTSPSPQAPRPAAARPALLEGCTAVVLVLVLLSLGWMALGACRPGWGAWVDVRVQVWAVTGLLGAALVLVSVVALRHTRA